jgi:hypothetical protein
MTIPLKRRKPAIRDNRTKSHELRDAELTSLTTKMTRCMKESQVCFGFCCFHQSDMPRFMLKFVNYSSGVSNFHIWDHTLY